MASAEDLKLVVKLELETGSDGANLIAKERMRQINEEGYTEKLDANWKNSELILAAICYADAAYKLLMDHTWMRMIPEEWPFGPNYWKPSKNAIRNLVKAGALIAAEIDRLQAESVR